MCHILLADFIIILANKYSKCFAKFIFDKFGSYLEIIIALKNYIYN